MFLWYLARYLFDLRHPVQRRLKAALAKLAKKLDDADELVLLGGGASGRDPLVFQVNGVPWRGFLEGRVDGKRYQLLLRLSNLELKRPEEKA